MGVESLFEEVGLAPHLKAPFRAFSNVFGAADQLTRRALTPGDPSTLNV
jgi:hypothetical protein